jgi:hypothetical protein
MWTREDMIGQLPKLVAVIDEKWLHRNPGWIEAETTPSCLWYQQCDHDLGILARHVNHQKLIACYRDLLRHPTDFIQTVYEIHGAALLATAASRVDLHVLRGDGSEKNFDVWAEIRGCFVNADSKTRRDGFPFNLRRRAGELGEYTEFWGERAIVDPNDASELGIPVRSPVAEADSKAIQALETIMLEWETRSGESESGAEESPHLGN